MLGRYELIAHLKNGGMAALYLGRRIQPADNRIFAVKVIHPHFLDDEDLVQMFLDEAGLSVRIQHPNVVHVEEVGEDRGMHFIAMEYIHGCSLAQLLQALIRLKRRMSPELAVHIAMAVAEGLHAAHELAGDHGEPLNVVHRDVSPQNVLLAHTGEIKLIDFGIAKSRMRIHHSQTGTSIRGKLRYMAPEHARGQTVDRRTDVYALGIVLWEMLTMRPLFWANTDFGVLAKVRDPKVDPPSHYVARIAPELDRVVLSALAYSPDDRPESTRAFRRLLAQSAPFADALDEDQVAELLHVILGEELNRRVHELPHVASAEISNTARETQSLKAEQPDKVLESFTSPGIEANLLEESLSYDLPADEVLAQLSSSPRTPPPPADTGTLDDAAGLESSGFEEGEDPTELMTREALAEVHEALNVLRQRSIIEGRSALRSKPEPLQADPTTQMEYPLPAEPEVDLGVTRRDAPVLSEVSVVTADQDTGEGVTVIDGTPLPGFEDYPSEPSTLEGMRDLSPLRRAEAPRVPAVAPAAPALASAARARIPTMPLASMPQPLGSQIPGSGAPRRHVPSTPPVQGVFPPPAGFAPRAAGGAPSSRPPQPSAGDSEALLLGGRPASMGDASSVPAPATIDTEVDRDPIGPQDEDYEPPTDVYQGRSAAPLPISESSAEPSESYVGLVVAVAVVGVLVAAAAAFFIL